MGFERHKDEIESQMNCSRCNKPIERLDALGWPNWYFGGTPQDSSLADRWFCGPECAFDQHIEDKENTHET